MSELLPTPGILNLQRKRVNREMFERDIKLSQQKPQKGKSKMNTLDYLKHQKTKGYLPKEQLRRLIRASGMTTESTCKATGLSERTISLIKLDSAISNKFSVRHAQSIVKNSQLDTEQIESFKADLDHYGFVIVYDRITWGKRIGAATNFDTLDEYEIALDRFLTTTMTLFKNPTTLRVISLTEIALALDKNTTEVLIEIASQTESAIESWEGE